MPSRTALVAALAALCATASAADAPTLSNRATRTFRVDPTPGKRIAEVKLFATTDDGATWSLAQELLVPTDTAEPPRLRWTAPADGAYGLRICVAYTDRQVDPEPQPGQEPEVRLLVDTTAPRIAACTVEPVATPAGHVRVAWSSEDPHPGTARLEYAPDGGAWTTLAELGGAAGEKRVALPMLVDAQRVSLRLVARDAAGNEAVSPPTVVPLTPAAPALTPPDDAFAQAVRGLPPVEPTPGASVQVERPTPPPETPAAHPDPATAQRPATGDGGEPQLAWAKTARPKEIGDGDQPLGPPTPAKPEKPEKPEKKKKPERKPAYRIAPPKVFLKGDDAERVLTQARAAIDDGRIADGLGLYRQLRDSDRARDAAPEELRALAASGAADEALALADGLPPEQRTDDVRIEHARLLRGAGRTDEALRIAAAVPRASPRADDAVLLVAACLRDQNRLAEARRMYQHLAGKPGPRAAEAAAELAALPAEP